MCVKYKVALSSLYGCIGNRDFNFGGFMSNRKYDITNLSGITGRIEGESGWMTFSKVDAKTMILSDHSISELNTIEAVQSGRAAEVERLRAELSILRGSEVRELRVEIDNLKVENAALSDSCRGAGECIDQLNDDLCNVRQERDKLNSDIERLQVEKDRSLHESCKIYEKFCNVVEERNELLQKCNDLSERLGNAIASRKSFAGALEELREEHRRREGEIVALTDQRNRARGDLQTCKIALSQMHEAYDNAFANGYEQARRDILASLTNG